MQIKVQHAAVATLDQAISRLGVARAVLSVSPPAGFPTFWSTIVCPVCKGPLQPQMGGAWCDSCDHRYDAAQGGQQLDLRLTAPKPYALTVMLGPDTAPSVMSQSLAMNPHIAASDLAGPALSHELKYGNRLNLELLSYFPKSVRPGQKMLDLGCGASLFKPICEQITGFDYIGVDYDGAEASLLVDAHALPFPDDTFDFIISIAVLEHLAFPDVAMAEALRVLRPGGVFIGTVAFLEPFHMKSYFHMTGLGVERVLRRAGFDIVALAPNLEWSGLRALAEMSLLPGLSGRWQRLAIAPLAKLSKALWSLKRALRGKDRASQLQYFSETTGGFRFVARRPS